MIPLPSSTTKLCFNSNCRQVLERSRKGWRRRTGEFADLCDRCASAYEEGKFCDSFHLNASGWRCCESCGKQIHCGCIVSFHMFVLLDAGGIECMTCARTSFILTPNPAWPPPALHLPGLPDKAKDHPVKSWTPIAGAGPLPWRQAPCSFNNNTTAQVEINPKMSFDVAGGIDRLYARERLSACSLDKKKNKDSSERLVNGSLKTGAVESTENEVSGRKCERQPTTYANVSQQLDFPNNERSTHISPILNPAPKTEIVDQNKISGAYGQRSIPPPGTDKHFPISVGVDSTSEARTHNGKPRGDARVRKYLPKITDKELQEISGDSNSVVTPLFEKILSASDAGRIGRLVLPKKCAEAYLPTISNPEGIPLMMQDLKGKEWVFQFRFWPNNNSRMYVLEGVTPCIHSMQLVAGDTITFSRLEPEGKLVVGCRKASTSPPEQNTDTVNTGNGVSTHRDVIFKASKPVEVVSPHLNVKGNSTSASLLTVNQANTADPASRWSEADKSKYIAKEPFIQSKRKNSTLGPKSKRLRIGNDQIIELKLTVGEAQRLFRPPSNIAPKILVIEGCEIAEFEEPPIIGRPTIIAPDNVGGTFQWAQCEDCFKWRKVPGDILFPSRWTCSENLWDPERSMCSAASELPPEELDDLLVTAGASKVKADKEEPDSLDALDGLDELANLAIHEQGDFLRSSSHTTSKHPRHRPGCTCIVCIQPPSGKGHKHKQTCTCNVCSTVKRRFHTMMSRRGKKQYEKEAETAVQKLQQPTQLVDVDTQLCNDTGKCSPSNEAVTSGGMGHDIYKKSPLSPFTGHIDLNMQPEREEDLSAVPDSGGMMRLLQNATERYLRQQKGSSTEANGNSVDSQAGVGGNSSNNVPLDNHDENKDLDHPQSISTITS